MKIYTIKKYIYKGDRKVKVSQFSSPNLNHLVQRMESDKGNECYEITDDYVDGVVFVRAA